MSTRCFGVKAWQLPIPMSSTRLKSTPTLIQLVQSRSHAKNAGNSSNSSSRASSFRLPDPTWSLQDLELSKQHAPISDAELQILAKRALLDVGTTTTPTTTTASSTTANLLKEDDNDDDGGGASSTTRKQLCQDLGNMMHMIEQLVSFNFDDTKATSNNNNNRVLVERDLYDTPRGVLTAPLRRDKTSNQVDDREIRSLNTIWGEQQETEEQEAKRVFESFLQPQTTKVGAHNYFSIETKTADN